MSKSVYTVVGVSTLNGVQKVRFANSMDRVKVLQKCGHTDIKLVEMPFAGTTTDALDHLLKQDWAATLPCVVAMSKKLGFAASDDSGSEEADGDNEDNNTVAETPQVEAQGAHNPFGITAAMRAVDESQMEDEFTE